MAAVGMLVVACSAPGSPVRSDVSTSSPVGTTEPGTPGMTIRVAPIRTGSGDLPARPDSSTRSTAQASTGESSTALRSRAASSGSVRTPVPGQFTVAFAGDVNFAGRTLARLDDPATAFGVARTQLIQADLTMVNLETAVTDRGEKQNKSFTFRAPATALTALYDAGVDIATMANNHGADYGLTGLQDSLAAARSSRLDVIGIGATADQAYAPSVRTINGVRVAVFAATQVQDETLRNWAAADNRPGVASAWSDRLIAAVRQAKAAGDVVVTYIHWGTEYTTCPDPDQVGLAGRLAAAGATAVVGTHAHVLQGAGWRPDGAYVAYGLSNYLWWRSFGNEQDDNGVLTLTFTGSRVTRATFAPAHLDDTGVPVPATGPTADRINAEWQRDRACANVAARPPSGR